MKFNFIIYLTQVLHHYKEEGFDFLLKAFNSPNYLEDLTGLSQLYAQTFDDQASIIRKHDSHIASFSST